MRPPVRYLRVFLLLLFSAVGAGLVALGRSALLEARSVTPNDTPAVLGRAFVGILGLGSIALGAVALILTATAGYVTRRPRLEADQEVRHPEVSDTPDHLP